MDDDPGSFSVEEPYSDFSYNSSLNISSPKSELKDMPETLNNYEVKSSIKNLIIKFAVLSKYQNKDSRLIKLNQYLISNNFFKEADQLGALIFVRNYNYD